MKLVMGDRREEVAEVGMDATNSVARHWIDVRDDGQL